MRSQRLLQQAQQKGYSDNLGSTTVDKSIPVTNDLFEAELFKLEALLGPITKALDMSEEFDENAMGKACADIAHVLNPDNDLSEEERESLCMLGLGTLEASNISHTLVATWKLHRQGMKPHPAADMLIRLHRVQGKIGPGAEAADLMIELPWMLKMALGYHRIQPHFSGDHVH